MANPLWTTLLNPHSPRYGDWRNILGVYEEPPLLDARTRSANLGEERDVPVYLLDIVKLSPDQRERLVTFVAEKFGVAPTVVNEQLESEGFPIREADVIVAFASRAFM